MRTTLDLEADVLAAAREIAERRKTTIGRVVSELARQALTRPAGIASADRNGFRVLPKRGGVVTSEMVARLAEDES